jgi:hypothetical protein
MPKSMQRISLRLASQIVAKPPPPKPLIQGSVAPKARLVATAASTAWPPAARIRAPAAAASRDCAATTPPALSTAGLR